MKKIKYNPQRIEFKWQKIWKKNEIHKISGRKDRPKKYYCLDMFPYPSGNGLHVGHMRGYTYSDVIARKKKMEGYNILHPMGWDAFGLPAENFAIKYGIHPQKSTNKNIENIRKDLNSAGYMYDWSREITTCEPDYYKWTQWLFIQLYKKGLAYRKSASINWCPSCKAGLANEEVVGGRCERCGAEVMKKNFKQWFFKITDYADRLLDDFDRNQLDWPEKVKIMQKNWIGRSYGTEFSMEVKYAGDHKMLAGKLKGVELAQAGVENPEDFVKIKVYTTRIDTVFGITYVVLAPEHPLVKSLTTPEQEKEVNKYIEEAKKKSEIERTSEEREKTGVFTGSYAINPVNGQEVPIWVADYVLAHYGTGAIMAVPAHDQRDYEFAEKYNLEIIEVIKPAEGNSSVDKEAFEEDGILVGSGEFSGLPSGEARKKITKWMMEKGFGFATKNYRLRDWLISRQRYWGAPIPIIYCEKCGEVVVPEDQLPVLLPPLEDFKPTGTGESPLAKVEKFVNTTCPKCGGPAKRETDTISQWVCSSWYYIRYADPKNNDKIFEKDKINYWLPVDLYVGGVEHAILHLLYSRFITKFLFDQGFIEFEEPFIRLFNQGMIYYKGAKMSKSKGNVVKPAEFFEKYGADTMRVYELFMGPAEQDVEWNDQGVVGVFRFLQKVWDVAIKVKSQNSKVESQKLKVKSSNLEFEKLRHKTIKKVTEDIENFRFNTAVSCLMEYVNKIQNSKFKIPKEFIETLLLLLAPMAPHICEELWSQFHPDLYKNKSYTIFNEKWPSYNSDLIIDKVAQIVIQINGKLRDVVKIDTNISEQDLLKIVKERPKILKYIRDKEIKKIIFVRGKLMNLVVV